MKINSVAFMKTTGPFGLYMYVVLVCGKEGLTHIGLNSVGLKVRG